MQTHIWHLANWTNFVLIYDAFTLTLTVLVIVDDDDEDDEW